jgi:nucleoid DNA-binding protein
MIVQSDITKLTAKELDLDERLIKAVVKSFWDSIRYYLNNPLEAGYGIKIHYFGTLKIKQKSLPYFIFRKEYSKEKTELLHQLNDKLNG